MVDEACIQDVGHELWQRREVEMTGHSARVHEVSFM